MTTLLTLLDVSKNFFGQPLYEGAGFMELLIHFSLNLLVIYIIAQFLYFPKSRRRDYFFSYILLGVCIFLLVFLLCGVKIKVGVALSLFAIFGIIRYRTEGIPIREMTYFFLIVTLSTVNGLSSNLSWSEIILANTFGLVTVWILENVKKHIHSSCKYVKYDNINLITPEKRPEMIADLEKRLGLKVTKVEVGSVNFLNDSALIKVYYEDNSLVQNSADQETKMPKLYE